MPYKTTFALKILLLRVHFLWRFPLSCSYFHLRVTFSLISVLACSGSVRTVTLALQDRLIRFENQTTLATKYCASALTSSNVFLLAASAATWGSKSVPILFFVISPVSGSISMSFRFHDGCYRIGRFDNLWHIESNWERAEFGHSMKH